MLFSRMVLRRVRVMAAKARKSEIERTAMGIEAETVMPTFSTRYIDDAEKMMPRIVPMTTADQVNSGTFVAVGEMNGWYCSAGDFSAGAGVLAMLALYRLGATDRSWPAFLQLRGG